jgi:lysophospholipase L1-like esterase
MWRSSPPAGAARLPPTGRNFLDNCAQPGEENADETDVTWSQRRAGAACVAAGMLAALTIVLWDGDPPPRPVVPPAEIAASAPAATPKASVTVRPGRMLRVMPLGDSITSGVGSTDGSGYRAVLAARLAAAGYRVTFVGSRRAGPPGPAAVNEGHPGWTIARLTGSVTGWLAAARPDVVLLHTGTNDIRTDAAAAHAPARLAILLTRIVRDRPRAQIFVAEIVGSSRTPFQRRIDGFNRAVEALVAAGPPTVHLVDQSGVRGRLLADGRHPDDAGYARMAATWAAAIRAVIATGPSRTTA